MREAVLLRRPDWLPTLPADDRIAIEEAVGGAVRLVGYQYGDAEIEFRDASGAWHTIWVDPSLIRVSGDAE